MAVIKVSAILLLAIVCNAAAVEIRCASRARNWCAIHENVPVSDTDKITITNTEPKETVKTFSWTWPTSMKTMPSVWFETFPKMENCDLSGTGIETITQSGFQNARMLKKLVLEKNNIRVIPASVFKMATNLTEMDLDDNRIVEMQDWALKGLDKLRVLTMKNNKIRTVTRNMLAGAPKLQIIHLSNNEIETIEEGSLELPHLKELHIDINHIKNMPVDVLNGVPLLKHLDLSNNLLTSIPVALLRRHKITTLIMDFNPMETVHIKEFMRIPSLEFLSLEDTGVKTVWPEAMTDKTTSTSMINHLDLTNNDINKVDILKQLVALTHLQTVILDENELQHIELNDIKTLLPSLSTISMEDTEIDCKWLKEWLPKMAEDNVELKSGNWDEDMPVTEQRNHVDTNLCGNLLM